MDAKEPFAKENAMTPIIIIKEQNTHSVTLQPEISP